MGLKIKPSKNEYYVNIESVNIDFGKKTLRIRTRFYHDKSDSEYIRTSELLINPENLKPFFAKEAEKMIDVKKLRLQINKKFKKKQERDLEFIRKKSKLLAEHKERLAKETMKNLFGDLDNTLKICYEYLKMYIGGKDS